MANPEAPRSFAAIGDFGRNPLSPDERERRRKFARLWEPLKIALRARGWSDFDAGAVVELDVSGSSSEFLKRIWLSPTRGEFRVRLDFRDVATHFKVLSQQSAIRPHHPPRVRVAEDRVKRSEGPAHVVEIRTSLKELFGEAQSTTEMSQAIADFVLAAVDGVERVARN